MNKLPELTRDKYVIGLDAVQDMYAAALHVDEYSVADFEFTFEAAAADLARRLGIEIEVVLIHQGPESVRCDDDDEARAIWQRLHDMIEFSPSQNQYIFYED